MKTRTQSINERICAFCLFLVITALGATILPSCKTGSDGKTTVDQEKLTAAFLAAGEAALAAKTGGASSGIVKQAAIQAGLAAIKTEPAPVELPVIESK